MKLRMLLLFTALFTLALTGVAFAQDGSIGPTQPGVADLSWVLLSATVVPLVVAIVTKWNSSSVLKAVLMAVLNVVSSSIIVWQTWPNNEQLTSFVFAGITAIVTSAGVYYGFWKPTTVAPKLAQATTPGPKNGGSGQ